MTRTADVLHAFEGCGLELEYVLVDALSLDVAPIADKVLRHLSGTEKPVNDYERDGLGWSNELVMHVIELKNVQPTRDFVDVGRRFQDEIGAMNARLQEFGARLMPGGTHPWMDPAKETRIWPHDHSPVYKAYDRIFGCRSHGWANLQATHVNLPFADDREFARLLAAVRVIVPIVPALAAASPYMEGRATGILDARMEAYRTNAEAVPELNGDLIPEAVATRAEYEQRVLKPIYAAIEAHDPDSVLRHEWLNARGAIARFDRNALEIRVMDTQECPRADAAFAALIFDLAQSLYERQFASPRTEAQLPNRTLARILMSCVHDADKARIDSPEFLQLFGLARRDCDAGSLWLAIAERLDRENSAHVAQWRAPVEFALTRGPLARRLVRAVGPRPSRAALHELYAALCDALAAGRQFDP